MIEDTIAAAAETQTVNLAGKIWPLGKYKGRTYANINFNDPHYIMYVQRSLRTNADRYAALDENDTSGDAIFYKAGTELLSYALEQHIWDHLLVDEENDNSGLDTNSHNPWGTKHKSRFNLPTDKEARTPAPKRRLPPNITIM